MIKIERLLFLSFKIACLVAIELFAYVVVCILLNSDTNNSVSQSIDLLLKGVIYG